MLGGPGGDDDLIRRLRGRRRERGVQPDVHAEPLEFSLVPGDVIEDLLPARLQASETPLPAELSGGLEQPHLVTALGSDSCHLHTCRSATNDNDPLARHRFDGRETIAAVLELPPS